MICEECGCSTLVQWPKGRDAVRCFSPELHGRVMNVYPKDALHRTEAPAICPIRQGEGDTSSAASRHLLLKEKA